MSIILSPFFSFYFLVYFTIRAKDCQHYKNSLKNKKRVVWLQMQPLPAFKNTPVQNMQRKSNALLYRDIKFCPFKNVFQHFGRCNVPF